MQQTEFIKETHEFDVCIVGGGIAGVCAAIASARGGAKTALVQDRSVLGGNASSEVRMWICGAHGKYNKESGILEEILLENLYRNPSLKYTIWDTVLYEKVRYQENLTLFLNTSCNDVRMAGNKIESIRCWQLTTQKWLTINATLFADCSGDSILRISGADFMWGREASDTFGESHAPESADMKTMGNSILIQLRRTNKHVPFIAPAWANKYTDEDLPNRNVTRPTGNNFWWMEFGGIKNTISDAEEIRDELYRIAYGVWDLMKNHPDGRGHEWELEWIGSLPGKRENVRYVGDHILTQNDVEAEGKFDDLVAYGGWPMDDHHPEAINYPGKPTIFHPAPSPYGIPYRSLYSRNIENLFMAGRNISATHMALSSTRVMGTCSTLGQAVGTAAAIAIRNQCTPRGVYEHHLQTLQNVLMDDDAYLPWHKRPVSPLCLEGELTASNGDAGALINGIDRQRSDDEINAWVGKCGDHLDYRFNTPVTVNRIRLVLDSYLPDGKRMPCTVAGENSECKVPITLLKRFRLESLCDDGSWETLFEETNNYQRLYTRVVDTTATAFRLVPEETWGRDIVRIFSFELI